MSEARITAVREKLAEWKVDGVLIGSAANRRWVSGFTGSAGQCLITADKALLATDSRYFATVRQQAPDFELFEHERTQADTTRLIETAGVRRLGIEPSQVTLDELDRLEAAAPNVTFVSLLASVESLRVVKTAVELTTLRRAAQITDLAMSQVNEIVQPGMSEKQIAWGLEKMMREAGADSLAFPIIVGSGRNGASPHHATSSRTVREGDAIVIDMGAKVDGYHADMTRTFFFGNEPTAQFLEIYNLVLAGQKAAIAAAKAGLASKALDAAARDVITAGGYGKQFRHGLGHGVGLEIHEDPFLSIRETQNMILQAGMVTSIEPGIYLSGWGGVRIEDLIEITADGSELISRCAKLPIIGIV